MPAVAARRVPAQLLRRPDGTRAEDELELRWRDARSDARLHGALLHERREAGQDVGIGLRQHAVTEVEDVARPAAARASTSRARASTRSHGPSSDAGSRLPWTPRSSPTTLQPVVERDAPVEPDHVAACARERVRAASRRARAEVDRRRRRPRRGCAPSTARRTPRSRPARARRPTSRRAASTSAPAPPARRRSARTCSASRSMSACHTAGSRYISAFVRAKSRRGLPSTR